MYLSVELENPAMPEITQVSAADFIGPRVKELCDKQQITKYRLSQMTGVTQTVLSRIIKRVNVPTIQTLEKICAALNIYGTSGRNAGRATGSVGTAVC